MSDPATQQKTVSLSVSRSFASNPSAVFGAWLDPEMASRFLFRTPDGQLIKNDIDARAGGKFTFTERRKGEDIEHTGRYVEIACPQRLVFTFAVPKFSAIETRVALDFAEEGAGCRLLLTHDGVLPEYEEKTKEGWTKILGGLAAALGE